MLKIRTGNLTHSHGWARTPSPEECDQHLAELGESIEAVHRGELPDGRCVAWPEGLDRALVPAMGLPVRIRNVFARELGNEGESAMTVREAMLLANFGRKSCKALIVGLEEFLTKHGSEAMAHRQALAGEAEQLKERRRARKWEEAIEVLSPVLAAGEEVLGARTLASVLHPDLVALCTEMGSVRELERVKLEGLAGDDRGPVAGALERLESLLRELPANQHTVLKHRIVNKPRKTLEDTGETLGVSRERVRQIEFRLRRRIEKTLEPGLGILARKVEERFGHIAWRKELDQYIASGLPRGTSPTAARLVHQEVIETQELAMQGEVYFDKEVERFVRELVAQANESADDTGLLDEWSLMQTLPSRDWERFWEWLKQKAQLREVQGRAGLRDSAKARVKAALLRIGRPATRKEVGEACGLDETAAGTCLSAIPSIVRSDKNTWGLREWMDEEYTSIVDEIAKRIEHRGEAVEIRDLLEELPAKLGVSRESVKTYMRCARFTRTNGRIDLADTRSIEVKNLEDVIDGRDAAGAPYWRFVVCEKHFRGHAVENVPPAFARALGCEPDRRVTVEVGNLPGQPEVSVGWHLSSVKGAWIGRVREALEALGTKAGATVRVTRRDAGIMELADEREGTGT